MTQTSETVPKKERASKTPEQKKAELQAKLDAEQKRLEKAREKKKKLEQKLKDLEQPKINRKQETRIKILYGAAIMTMMKQEPELERKVMAFLSQITKRESDRKILELEAVNTPMANDDEWQKIIKDPEEGKTFSFNNIKRDT